MTLSVSSFSPSTKIESAPVNTNFTTLVNALNNLRPTLYVFLDGGQTTGTNKSGEFVVKSAATLTFSAVNLNIKTAPTGADFIVDINKNGNSIFGTRPQITAGQTTGGTGATFTTTTVTAGDIITVDIDQVGSSVAGTGLSIALAFQL